MLLHNILICAVQSAGMNLQESVYHAFYIALFLQVPANFPTSITGNVASFQRGSPMSVDCGTNVATQPTGGNRTVIMKH